MPFIEGTPLDPNSATDASSVNKSWHVRQGLSLGPPASRTEHMMIEYDIRKEAQPCLLQMQVGLDDSSGASEKPGVIFEVLGDDKLLWTSTLIKKIGAFDDCRINLQGVKRLTLRYISLDTADNQRWTLPVWINPYLLPLAMASDASLKLVLPTEVTVTAGEATTALVQIERVNCDGEIKLLPDVQVEGVTLRLSPIAEGKSGVNIRVEVDAKVKSGKHTVGILARGPGKVEAEGTYTVQVKPAVVALEKEITNSIGMKLKLIPKGTFQMGSSKEDRAKVEQHLKDLGFKPEDYKMYLDWETPQHEVAITKPFYLAVYEVTQEEFEKLMGSNPSWFRKGAGNEDDVKGLDTKRFPVEHVSWDEAVKFCETLTNLPKERETKRLYRLPTESEWEYASRAGTSTLFHYGNTLSDKDANFFWLPPLQFRG